MGKLLSHRNALISLHLFLPNLKQITLWVTSNLDPQNAWVISHTMTLLGAILHFYSLASEAVLLQQNSYKLATLGSLFTYLIVLYRCFTEDEEEESSNNRKVRIKRRSVSASALLQNENTQLLGYVILWNFTERSLLKLTPFFIYSFLNVSSFVIVDMFPLNSFCSALVPLFNYLEVPLLILASYIDLVVFGVLLKETAYIYKTGYPLLIYLFLYITRFENSEASRSSVIFIIRFIDDQIQQELVSRSIQEGWSTFRHIIEPVIPYDYNKDYDDGSKVLNEANECSALAN